ncbi:MAG: glycerol-3-phosphate acyltransferase [Chloroflexi bacterium]|nr:glycerol-3-phosphate acyltransferase [Chloroflexota bacterium]
MEILGAPAGGVLALTLGAYLFGAIPTAYLAARWKRGVDIRRHGSGNVGGTNVIQVAGRTVGLFVVAFDMFIKGPLPVILAGSVLGYGKGVEVVAGTAVLIGHDWSVFLRFSGGRGLGTGSGAALVMAWPAWVVFVIIGFGYWAITRNSPVGWAIALLLSPFVAVGLGLAGEYIIYAVIFTAVSAIKRVASNPGERRTPRDMSSTRLVWNRLVYDRDIEDRDAWLRGDAGR